MKREKNGKSLPFFGVGKVLPYTRNCRGALIIMLAFGTLFSLTDIVVPLFQRYALDRFIGGKTLDSLGVFIVLFALVITAGGVFHIVSTTFAAKVEYDVDRDLRNAAFDHLQTLSLSYFNKNSVGYIHARVISDTARLGELVSWVFRDMLWQTAYLVGVVAVMLSINTKLALMVLAIIPLVSALFALFQKKLISVNREIRELNSKITGDFNEGITGAKTIKTLAIEKKMTEAFYEDTSEIRRKSVRAGHLRGVLSATMELASSTALAVVLWKGGVIAENQIGTFALFMSYAEGMMEPVRWTIDCISDLIATQVNIERFTRLMETRPDVTDSPEVLAKYGGCFDPKKENWEPMKGDLEFEDVSFRYPDGDELVLEHFNLKIPFGTNVAVAGETGAGKSTLVNLVCRFFEPTGGRVLVDGRDLRERSQLWLHAHIGYVLQTPHLFSGTVRENLLYGNPDATDEKIDNALRMVSAKDIVDRMENGLDSDVGEGGNLLSAGEKQLVSFARAVLADPRILILDEATASVDTLTEQKILSAMQTVIQGRTSIVIAHRLSTIRDADIILVVKDGRIIERGRHEELMEKKGRYYELYTLQYENEATASALRN